MNRWSFPVSTGRHIIVADEDPKMVEFVIRTLREDGHAVFHAYDVLSATQLALGLEACDLVISNTKVEGADGVELMLSCGQPDLPIIYLANIGRSTPKPRRSFLGTFPFCGSRSLPRTFAGQLTPCLPVSRCDRGRSIPTTSR